MAASTVAGLLGAMVSVVADPAPSDEATDALLSSCSSVFRETDEPACVEGESDAPFEAVVVWSRVDDELHAEVRLVLGAGRELVRPLSFGPGASDDERWEAMGLVLAALVNVGMVENERSSDPGEEKTEPPPPVVVQPSPQPTPPWHPPTSFQLGVAALGAGNEELMSLGGLLRASIATGSAFVPTLAVGGFIDGGPLPQWLVRPSLGLSWVTRAEPFVFSLRAEGLAVVTRFSAESGDGREDSSFEPRWGGSLGGEAKLHLGEHWGVFAGGGVLFLFPALDVRVASESVLMADVVGWEAAVGASFDL